MKHQNIIEHTLKLEGETISGQITKVNWGKYLDCEGEEIIIDKGGYRHLCLSKDFRVVSIDNPMIDCETLFLFGDNMEDDNKRISYTYDTEERAEEVIV